MIFRHVHRIDTKMFVYTYYLLFFVKNWGASWGARIEDIYWRCQNYQINSIVDGDRKGVLGNCYPK